MNEPVSPTASTKSKTWSDESLARALELYLNGVSCSEVAKALSAEFGIRVSKNAVIGKLTRSGYKTTIIAREKPAKPVVRAARPLQVHKPKPAPIPRKTYSRSPVVAASTQSSRLGVRQGPLEVPPSQKADETSVDLLSLAFHHCRFPLENERGQTVYCGRCKQENSSYCPDHHFVCHVRPHVAKRVAAKDKTGVFHGGWRAPKFA